MSPRDCMSRMAALMPWLNRGQSRIWRECVLSSLVSTVRTSSTRSCRSSRSVCKEAHSFVGRVGYFSVRNFSQNDSRLTVCVIEALSNSRQLLKNERSQGTLCSDIPRWVLVSQNYQFPTRRTWSTMRPSRKRHYESCKQGVAFSRRTLAAHFFLSLLPVCNSVDPGNHASTTPIAVRAA